MSRIFALTPLVSLLLLACQSELTAEEARRMPLPPPRDLSAAAHDDRIELRWRGSSSDAHCFLITRSVGGDESEELGCVIEVESLEWQTFVDDSPPSGELTYAVKATSTHYAASQEVEVQVTDEGG